MAGHQEYSKLAVDRKSLADYLSYCSRRVQLERENSEGGCLAGYQGGVTRHIDRKPIVTGSKAALLVNASKVGVEIAAGEGTSAVTYYRINSCLRPYQLG